MKIVELILDEEEMMAGVQAIPIVEYPAIEENFVKLSKDQEIKLAEVDSETKLFDLLVFQAKMESNFFPMLTNKRGAPRTGTLVPFHPFCQHVKCVKQIALRFFPYFAKLVKRFILFVGT